jgi:cell division protein FtsZ
LRRDLSARHEEQEDDSEQEDYRAEEPKRTQSRDNIAPFQSRTERIQKEDSDQPAFLRKIMD